MDYLIEIEDIESLTIKDLNDFLIKKDGLDLSVLKISHLVFYNDVAIRYGNGVYLFREIKRPIYVGNCVARNFVERIPAHFDVRHNGWFNSLLLSVIQEEKGRRLKEDKTDENLEIAARYALEKFNLILINFSKHDKNAINRLESLMRMLLNPVNRFKNKHLQKNEMQVLVKDYIYDSAP